VITSEQFGARRSIIVRFAPDDNAKLEALMSYDQRDEIAKSPPFATVREISAGETIRRLIRRAYDERKVMHPRARPPLDEEAKLRGHGAPNRAEWWESPEHVKETEALLVRAGILSEPPNDDDGPEYQPYAKPWKWDRERTIARVLERTFEMVGIPVEEAWGLTGAEVMAEMQKRDAKRGLR